MSVDEWWTDCCDQLFLGFKTPRLWVAQQCRSSTPPPTSRRGRHITASFLDGRRGGNKRTLRQKDEQTGGLVLCLKTATVNSFSTGDWILSHLVCLFLGLLLRHLTWEWMLDVAVLKWYRPQHFRVYFSCCIFKSDNINLCCLAVSERFDSRHICGHEVECTLLVQHVCRQHVGDTHTLETIYVYMHHLNTWGRRV